MNVSLVWKGKTINGNDYAYTAAGLGTSITYQKIPSTGIPPNSMAIVFLNDYEPGQRSFKVQLPVEREGRGVDEDMVIHCTSIGNAMEIKTSVPGGRLRHLSVRRRHVVHLERDAPPADDRVGHELRRDDDGPRTPHFPPGVDFVAQQDGTQVTLLPTTNITAGGGVARGDEERARRRTTSTRARRSTSCKSLDSSGNDLTGSIVQSNYPDRRVGRALLHGRKTQPADVAHRRRGRRHDAHVRSARVSGAPTTLNEGQLVEFAGPRRVPRQVAGRQAPVLSRRAPARRRLRRRAPADPARSRRSAATTSPSATRRPTTASADPRR